MDGCKLCQQPVDFKKQIATIYPCQSTPHVFHMSCLLSYDHPQTAQERCPICEVQTTKIPRVLKAYLAAKKTLNLGDNIKQLNEGLQIDLLLRIAKKKYPYKFHAVSKYRADRREEKKSYFSLLSWGKPKQEEGPFPEFPKIEPVGMMIKGNINSLIIRQTGYTMKDIVQDKITIDKLIKRGYDMIDWWTLEAEWHELLTIGMKAKHFKHYPQMMDIESMIEYYGLTFDILFSKLCNDQLEEMVHLGLTLENYKQIKFDFEKAQEYDINSQTMKVTGLWQTLKESEWAELGFTPEKSQ